MMGEGGLQVWSPATHGVGDPTSSSKTCGSAQGSWESPKGLLADETNGARRSDDEIGDAIGEAGAAAGLGET